MFAAQRLRRLQIFLRRNGDSCFRLYWLHDGRGEFLGGEFFFKRRNGVEGNSRAIPQQRAEAFLPEVRSHQRKRSAGESVESALAINKGARCVW